MSQISIWPLGRTWLGTWWHPCWQSQRSGVSCGWPPGCTHGGILSRSSLQILSKSFRGWCLVTWIFSSLSWFSTGWKSGEHGELSWCHRAGFVSHLTTTLSPSSPLNHWQTSDGLYMCFLEQGSFILTIQYQILMRLNQLYKKNYNKKERKKNKEKEKKKKIMKPIYYSMNGYRKHKIITYLNQIWPMSSLLAVSSCLINLVKYLTVLLDWLLNKLLKGYPVM